MTDDRLERFPVALGGDHAGYRLKERLKPELQRMGFPVLDFGTESEEPCDYPDFAVKVAEAVSGGKAGRGILVCGTGVGMAMVANKVPGIRAAVCNDEYCARQARLHNDANVLTIGARVVDEDRAGKILRVFMETGFEGESPAGARHLRRLEKMKEVERRYLRD